MFKIYDGREHFYQWDLDRKLIIEDPSVIQVHFCNRTDNCALVCETYVEDGLTLVNVPNILLQTDWRIHVYAYDGKHTKHDVCYDVKSRTKPSDYAYTETEILNWSKIDSEVTAAIGETEGAIARAEDASNVAYNAASQAHEAAASAEASADIATEATADTINATEDALNAAAYATEAASGVIAATDSANAAATLATNAATNANTAAGAVNDAIEGAGEAISAAATAAATAVKATDAAMKATQDAITATTGANEAAASANTAADNANAAIEGIEDSLNGFAKKIINTMEGESIVVPDSENKGIEDLKIYGKTTQTENLNGSENITINFKSKNIFNNDTSLLKQITFHNSSGVDITRAGYDPYALTPGKYTFTAKETSGEKNMYIYGVIIDADYNTKRTCHMINGAGINLTPKTITIAEGEYLLIYCGSNTTSLGIGRQAFNGVEIQIEEGEIATDYVPYSEQTITISTPNGLKGIPSHASSTPTYIDENGQKWICDTIDFTTGEYTQRIGYINSYNGESITTDYMSSTGELTTGAEVVYVLKESAITTTKLSDEEIAAYKALYMNYPVTRMINDVNAHMKVKYIADTKYYVDSRSVEVEEEANDKWELVSEYTHSGNLVVQPTALDMTTGYFTCENHGLTTGDCVTAFYKIKNQTNCPIPYELLEKANYKSDRIYPTCNAVTVIDENTFMITGKSKYAETNNKNVDVTKFSFETQSIDFKGFNNLDIDLNTYDVKVVAHDFGKRVNLAINNVSSYHWLAMDTGHEYGLIQGIPVTPLTGVEAYGSVVLSLKNGVLYADSKQYMYPITLSSSALTYPRITIGYHYDCPVLQNNTSVTRLTRLAFNDYYVKDTKPKNGGWIQVWKRLKQY
jgi:hypothetical protein